MRTYAHVRLLIPKPGVAGSSPAGIASSHERTHGRAKTATRRRREARARPPAPRVRSPRSARWTSRSGAQAQVRSPDLIATFGRAGLAKSANCCYVRCHRVSAERLGLAAKARLTDDLLQISKKPGRASRTAHRHMSMKKGLP